jgi:site-specific recombinase XerC
VSIHPLTMLAKNDRPPGSAVDRAGQLGRSVVRAAADVNVRLRRVRVMGKGHRERVVPVDPAFFTKLAIYLQRELPAGSAPECFVVLRGPTAGGR